MLYLKRIKLTKCAVLLASFFIFGNLVLAGETELLQLKIAELDPAVMPGYVFDFDQVFKINSGPLKGKTIFFALNDREAEVDSKTKPARPQFVVADTKILIDHKAVPTLEEGWNISSVDAMAVMENKAAAVPLRILAILTIEPVSGRSSDYWQQAFVFDLTKEGKIKENVSLNKKLSNVKPAIKTIRALKKHLEVNPG